ncbi:low affinity immunoglobulin epsilon Fc receptor-like [Brienomyrus brachyistius]|uniref:low affinity immunoglobulin epsilon Fc receptor-like n=1 Tax=Brienomyrus brachyistius TaxID=42636 RepID=UPI0020B241ED|nr:low affinity immunoglobulin epsilon Fc receptor-like [Brienomyrus brachyistius]
MSANVVYSVVNFRRKRQDDATDVVYSQVKFPDPLPLHSASLDGQAVEQGEDVIYSQVKLQPPLPPRLQAETEWTQKTSYSQYRVFALGLGLLFLLLFISIIFLSVHVHRGNQIWSVTEDNLKQLRTNYSILAKEKDQIQNNYDSLAKEKDRLQEDYSFLVKKKEQLQDNYNMLANVKNQLQEENKMLANDKNQLQEENIMLANDKNQLQEENKMLANDKNQLQEKNKMLANAKDQLKKEYNILTRKPGEACRLCPEGWMIFNHKCYFQNRNKKKWEESKTYCGEHGGNLAVIESREEQEFIKTIIKDGNSWIGLSDREQEGVWLWVNGAQLKKSFWAVGKPNNRPELQTFKRPADCVYFHAKDGVWFDDNCDRQLNSLCETEAF